jgi:hypothetical protein
MTAVLMVALMFSTACAPPPRGAEVRTPASLGPDTEVVLEGRLEVLIEDSAQGSRTLYFLNTTDTRVPLRFSRPPKLLTGAHIRVHGQWAASGDFEVASFEAAAQ